MKAIIVIDDVQTPINLYARTSSSGKAGYGINGRVAVNGVEHMVNGFVSPITPMSAKEKAEKREARKAFEQEWAKTHPKKAPKGATKL